MVDRRLISLADARARYPAKMVVLIDIALALAMAVDQNLRDCREADDPVEQVGALERARASVDRLLKLRDANPWLVLTALAEVQREMAQMERELVAAGAYSPADRTPGPPVNQAEPTDQPRKGEI